MFVSSSRRTSNRRPPPKSAHGPLAGASRAQIILVIVSMLVICSMVGGVFVGLTQTEIFGNLFSDGGDEENYANPNSDIIAAQETIVASNPDSVEDVLLLANFLANSGRLGDAIPHFEHVLELAPDDINARLTFARALADGDLIADAELQFNKVLEVEPDNQEAHYYLARMYMESTPQRTDEAVPHYQRVVEIDSTTLIAEQAQQQLDVLGVSASPEAATPAAATPQATPS